MSPALSRRVPLGTGLTYHVLEWGAGADHTVVLIHGFLDLAWGWEETVAAGLGGRFHVVAPDMRGHGDSDPVGAGGYYHFADYLADLHELLGQVAGQDGGRKVSLVGHSMGGSIASYYAGAFPDRVHKLALLEGTGPPEDRTPLPERAVNWLLAWRRVRERGQRTYGSLDEAAGRLRETDPLLSEALSLKLAEHGTRPGPDGRLRFKHDPLHVTPGPLPFRLDYAEAFWSRITCPVLLVEGAQSFFRHPDAERRERSFARARKVVLEGAGHMMQRHQPAALARVLGDFLG